MYDIFVRTSDFHSITDEKGERVNQSQDIIIGNHVWIGQGAYLLKGTIIPDNCIVGARALVSKPFRDTQSIIAGIPAKVVKENVHWSR